MRLREGIGQNEDTIELLLDSGFEEFDYEDEDPFTYTRFLGPDTVRKTAVTPTGPVVSEIGSDRHANISLRSRSIKLMTHVMFSTAVGYQSIMDEEITIQFK